MLGIPCPLRPGAPGRLHEAGGGLHGLAAWVPTPVLSCPAGSQTQTWLRDSAAQWRLCKPRASHQELVFQEGGRLVDAPIPALPQEAWGSRVPTPGAPPRSGQKVASVGTVPESSKIILSTNSHFPRKRASIAQIHPISCKKAFDFTPSGPFLRVGVLSYAWHTPQGPLCGWVSAHAGDMERHQGREAHRTG